MTSTLSAAAAGRPNARRADTTSRAAHRSEISESLLLDGDGWSLNLPLHCRQTALVLCKSVSRRGPETPSIDGMHSARLSGRLSIPRSNRRLSEVLPGGYMLSTCVRMTIEWFVPLGQTRPITMALHSLAADTRTTRGCIGCSVSTDIGNRGTIRYVEEWQTEDDL